MRRRSLVPTFGVWLAVVLGLHAERARADIANFDLAGRIYTKWLYRNNDSQGVLNYGNPFWPDNIAGDNGVGSEFELLISGRVSKYVEAQVRIKSRFGAVWQDWWENGDQAYGPFELNTSGESLGANHAEYMKLRGYWMEIKPPVGFVDVIRVGSSDMDMFNPWTIGKVRYIDRDNGKGIFVQGTLVSEVLRYHAVVVALPKLWVGPWWSTGIGDPSIRNPFWSRDWAYGLRLDATFEDLELSWMGTLTRDMEIDIADPDAQGTLYPDCTDALGNPIPGCAKDGAVDTLTRYANLVTTFEAKLDLLDGIVHAEAFGGFASQRIDTAIVANGVAQNDGVFPVVFKDTDDFAARVRVEIEDPFEIGLSFKLEYFNIGAEWNTIFGSRREADVLLTDGLLGGYQLPTLNLANEFMDFDEDFAETIIGWHGATLIAELEVEELKLLLEGTYITYNTNAQERDVEQVYPDFLHTDGYTDIDIFDYANVLDRGRDPRSVYARNKERRTFIGLLRGGYRFSVGQGLRLGWKLKYIRDEDFRSLTTAADDYVGDILQARVELRYPVGDDLDLTVGGQIDRWFEDNRRGTLEQGYGDDRTDKEKAFVKVRWVFGGFFLGWTLEYVHKFQLRERDVDQTFGVFRGKATAEVAW